MKLFMVVTEAARKFVVGEIEFILGGEYSSPTFPPALEPCGLTYSSLP